MRPAFPRLTAAVLCGCGLLVCTGTVVPGWARAPKKAAAAAPAAPAAQTPSRADNAGDAKLAGPAEKVLDAMDRQAQTFAAAQTDVLWDQYESAVEDHTFQSGTMWVLKKGKNLEMAVDLWPSEKGVVQKGEKGAAEKYVVFSAGKVQVFQPKINQVMEYDTGKNRQAFESLLVLGFGGGGHGLLEQFNVRYGGREALKEVGTERQIQEGASTEKLELTPKTNAVGRIFSSIELWIDSSGTCLQQKFYENASGNYRLVRYTHIKLNPKLHDEVFKLKTNGNTQFVHQ